MIFIGIDPGLSGAIATITTDEVLTHKMPVLIERKKKVYYHFALKTFFQQFRGLNPYAVLEQQHPMPKQGVTSMFSIGYGFGALKQCLVDCSIPHEIVRAQVWQKEFGISARKGNTKTQALQVCQDLFPNVNLLATERSKKPHDGIVDALLIAEYSRRRFSGTASQFDRSTMEDERKEKGGMME